MLFSVNIIKIEEIKLIKDDDIIAIEEGQYKHNIKRGIKIYIGKLLIRKDKFNKVSKVLNQL